MLMQKIKKAFLILKKGDIKDFLNKFSAYFNNKLNFFSIPFVINKVGEIKESFEKSGDVNELFDVVSAVAVISSTQIKSEITKLLEILRSRNINSVLEIGTATGGSIFLFSEVVNDKARLVTVDMHSKLFGYGYPSWRIPIYKSFPRGKQIINLIRGDSHTAETLKDVKMALVGEKVDFLFIDGDHSYEGVKKDFEMYGPLVKSGGVVAFHDIVDGPEAFVGGVPRFWKEIKNNYKHDELVENWKQGGLGIGILYL